MRYDNDVAQHGLRVLCCVLLQHCVCRLVVTICQEYSVDSIRKIRKYLIYLTLFNVKN